MIKLTIIFRAYTMQFYSFQLRLRSGGFYLFWLFGFK